MGTLSPDLVTMSQTSAEIIANAGRRIARDYVWLAPATRGQQLDELEGWLDRQKDHDAGDWPEAGEFTGGKHDRHASADDFQA